MLMWIKRKFKGRKKDPMMIVNPEITPIGKRQDINFSTTIDGEHVYEEISEATSNGLYESQRSKGKRGKHRPVQIQRSISFQDVYRPESKRNSKMMTRYNSSARLPPLSSSSGTSSLVNTPTNSTANLHPLKLLPHTHIDSQLVNPDIKFRAMPLHSNIYLPRKAATFASADTEMSRKRVKFQNRQNDVEYLYSATGSDSGYGMSNYNSTGSDESDTAPRGNYDTYVMKMEELLRLEKEVRNILRTIRGEDEPDDGYQNSRYFQDDPRFADVMASHSPVPTHQGYENEADMRLPYMNQTMPSLSPSRVLRQNSNTQHLPLRRLSDKSSSPETPQRAVAPRVGPPLPSPPLSRRNSIRRNSTHFQHRDISITPTPDRRISPSSDMYLEPTTNCSLYPSPALPQTTSNFLIKPVSMRTASTKRIVTSSPISRGLIPSTNGQCTAKFYRSQTPTNDVLLKSESKSSRTTPLTVRSTKLMTHKIQNKAHLPMSLHTNNVSKENDITVSESVCVECSKRCAATPMIRRNPIVCAPQWDNAVDYCNIFDDPNYFSNSNNSEVNRQRANSISSLI